MYADLSWVLENNWIGEFKWYYSQEAGRDIGTPNTVDKMLARSEQLRDSDYPATRGGRPADVSLLNLERFDRLTLIKSYLLDTTRPDMDGVNQLEGELRRFVAQQTNVKPSDVQLTRDQVRQYSTTYGLNEISESIVNRLRL